MNDMNSNRFTLLAILFCVCLIASNIFENIIFTAGPVHLTGGFLIFPISYIINDCISEVYGFRHARFVIITAFGVNLAFVLLAWLVSRLPAAGYCEAAPHFAYIFNADLRITSGSMLAFVAGSLLNAHVMVRMKARSTDGRGFGWRAVASSLVGETADSLIFFPIAFWGVGGSNILRLMLTQIILKTLYEVVVLPLTTVFVRYLKKKEGETPREI